MAKTKKTQAGLDLTRRLAVYSAAVGAGLVGASRADAAIHSSTGLNQSLDGSYVLTMEGGNAELYFWARSGSDSGVNTENFIGVGSSSGDGARVFAVGSFNNCPLVGRLALGSPIGSATNTPLHTWGNHYVSYTGSASGNWNADGDTGYMGFSFLLNDGAGSTVYGWAEIERVSPSSANLLGWGYEDSGAAIAAGATAVPEPSGLALLALGATGVAALRRRRSAA
jgi:hypothetical protein